MNKSNQMTNNPSNLKEISTFLKKDSIISEIQKVLGRKADSFVTSALTAINQNDMLKDAEKTTVYTALLNSAAMDLPIDPNLGFAYLVPFKNRKKGITECQFQMGWKGYVQLAQRTNQYKTMASTPIYEGQIVSINPMTGFEFDFSVQKTGKPIGYAAYFLLINGFEKTLYMSMSEINEHARQYSQSFKQSYGPWKDNFDAMAMKTVLKLLISKYGPLSTELERAMISDSAVINDVETMDVDYADNKTLSIEETKDEQERERVKNFIDQVDSIEKLKEVEDASVQYGLFESYTLKSQELSK